MGLGDYKGGGLVVEGSEANIRYQPLEFDGWNQRHWTLPFEVSWHLLFQLLSECVAVVGEGGWWGGGGGGGGGGDGFCRKRCQHMIK